MKALPAVSSTHIAPSELPWLVSGNKWFEGSAGLAITWWIDNDQPTPLLVCSLYTRAKDEPESFIVPSSGVQTIKLDPWSGAQSFDVVRPPAPGDPAQGRNVDFAQAKGEIYLGGLLATPRTPASTHTLHAPGCYEPVYLHVHCRLGESRWFLAKIAQGNYAQFLLPPETAVEADEPDASREPELKPTAPAKNPPAPSGKRKR
ncbi:hypothetical protein [Dyella silvatica]|uniref:hypothetical protein n=1 Tax=Dyella silvatica TaxID=2992128 RepID=UPI002255DFB8|nr:hypothetical protein [Dyella silvatica]